MHAIDSRIRYPNEFLEVRGKKMAYVEAGEGDPIVFLHGNITSAPENYISNLSAIFLLSSFCSSENRRKPY
jgi:hypothetical protein